MKTGFLNYITTHQPTLLKLLTEAERNGIIHLDYDNDAICPSHRLLLTYPGMHQILCRILNDWAEKKCDNSALLRDFLTNFGLE